MNPYIESINIGDFRGLTNLEITNLGQFNLFVGYNNAGKTSILEAINLTADPFDWPGWLAVARGRDVRTFEDLYPRVELLKWLFHKKLPTVSDQLFEGRIQISSSGTTAINTLEAWGTEIIGLAPAPRFSKYRYSDPAGSEEQPGLTVNVRAEGKGFDVRQDNYTFWETSEVARSSRSPSRVALVLPETHRITSRQIALYSASRLKNFKSDAIDAVRLIDPDVIGLELLSPPNSRRPIPYVNHAKMGLAPLNIFGDGFRRTLTLALTLASVPGGVLLVDEIETALHRDALARVYSWLVEIAHHLDVQVIATTHSLEAVDAILEADRDMLGEITAYRMTQRGSSRTATRLSGHELWDIRNRSGMDIR